MKRTENGPIQAVSFETSDESVYCKRHGNVEMATTTKFPNLMVALSSDPFGFRPPIPRVLASTNAVKPSPSLAFTAPLQPCANDAPIASVLTAHHNPPSPCVPLHNDVHFGSSSPEVLLAGMKNKTVFFNAVTRPKVMLDGDDFPTVDDDRDFHHDHNMGSLLPKQFSDLVAEMASNLEATTILAMASFFGTTSFRTLYTCADETGDDVDNPGPGFPLNSPFTMMYFLLPLWFCNVSLRPIFQPLSLQWNVTTGMAPLPANLRAPRRTI